MSKLAPAEHLARDLFLERDRQLELPRADLVLFVTSCDRPYTASESAFLKLIADRWRRKIVFVLSKTDIKEPEEVEEELIQRAAVARGILESFATTVQVLGSSINHYLGEIQTLQAEEAKLRA